MLEEFIIPTIANARLNMPEVVRHSERKNFTCVHPSVSIKIFIVNFAAQCHEIQKILFIVNVQHNCIESGCSDSDTREVFQERMKTKMTERVIKHTDNGKFILNMHALHNAAHIRKVLPRNLTAPKPYIQDRVSLHREAAAQLRDILHARRETTKATKALRKKNTTANINSGPTTAPTPDQALQNQARPPDPSEQRSSDLIREGAAQASTSAAPRKRPRTNNTDLHHTDSDRD